MTNQENERQDVLQLYENLDESDRIIFRSILDLAIVLLKNVTGSRK